MIAIAGLLLIVALSLVVTRVATVILVATGMSTQSARFQARSALSGAGFTTSESENVVQHPVRRKVIANLMLIGSAGVVAASGSLIIGFRNGAIGGGSARVFQLVAGLLVIVWISRSTWVDRRLTSLIRAFLRRYTDVKVRDSESLIALSGDYEVIELGVNDGDWMVGRTLTDAALREEGVAVLGIERVDGHYVGVPDGASSLQVGDVLIAYGKADQLAELDDRPTGPDGDLAHEAAIVRHRRTRRQEHRDDPQRAEESSGS